MYEMNPIRHARNNKGSGVSCATWSVPKGCKRYRKSLAVIEFQSCKGIVVWPEVVVEEESEVGL
jgi:hypothetical protein